MRAKRDNGLSVAILAKAETRIPCAGNLMNAQEFPSIQTVPLVPAHAPLRREDKQLKLGKRAGSGTGQN
ncbi:hypothetical protein CHH27_20810 [Labrenzia sp. VG12]|nr:hypothetical protein CHH27_20810 [Labrenzia sp. VG12]